MLLAAWKLALPAAVFLLRGNHESATCTLMYGFKGELLAKYGKRDWRVRGRTKRWLGGMPWSRMKHDGAAAGSRGCQLGRTAGQGMLAAA